MCVVCARSRAGHCAWWRPSGLRKTLSFKKRARHCPFLSTICRKLLNIHVAKMHFSMELRPRLRVNPAFWKSPKTPAGQVRHAFSIRELFEPGLMLPAMRVKSGPLHDVRDRRSREFVAFDSQREILYSCASSERMFSHDIKSGRGAARHSTLETP